jgi:hypothetical protein
MLQNTHERLKLGQLEG